MLTPDNFRFISPPAIGPAKGYTHVVEVTGGRTIYISGQVADDQNGNLVGLNDFRAQAIQVFENLNAALASVGATFANVVKINNYLLDLNQLPVYREIRNNYINLQNPPASTALEVSRLAKSEYLLEVEVIANLK